MPWRSPKMASWCWGRRIDRFVLRGHAAGVACFPGCMLSVLHHTLHLLPANQLGVKAGQWQQGAAEAGQPARTGSPVAQGKLT